MIGRICGSLIEKKPPELLLDVAGVGYEIQAPMTTFYDLPELGSQITLYTHFVVREDAQLLYGFTNTRERELFRTLIKVSGVGPKLALAILSGIMPDEFVRCVMDHDTASLVRLPGVGKKTAERLIVEVRDRLVDWETNALPLGDGAMLGGAASAVGDAIGALIALGYRPQDARRVVSRFKSEELSSEELIRKALKELC